MTIGAEHDGVSDINRTIVVEAPSLTTPAGLDAIATLNKRRRVVLFLNLATWLLIVLVAGVIFTSGGWTVVGITMVICLALGAPWPVLGFWNAVIGLWQLHGTRRKTHAEPYYETKGDQSPLTVNTAVLMTLRNEDPARALLRLKTVKASLDRMAEAGRFSYFVLSDSDQGEIIQREEAEVAAWKQADPDPDRIIYRRRIGNSGFKAGNVREFALRWGSNYEFMLPLDADSLMTGEAIVTLVRIMEKHPRIGILQSLVVGTPSSSAFARIFQFGMRLGMRTYTMGQAWWVGDCGPFWGHNALVRVAPFVEHCAMKGLLKSETILSHDQVEAVLMRKAGYEVRVLPVETGSYEDNPPDALEFMRRDARWCQGNMQYLRLIGMPGIEPVSRFQLIWAILMFLGVPAWTLLAAILPLAVLSAERQNDFPWFAVETIYGLLLLMHLAPKLAGIADAILTPGEINRFGGRLRFASSAIIEILFSLVLGAVTTIRTSIFMFGLLFGRTIVWNGQRRDGGGVTWGDALRWLWPQLLFGVLLYVAIALVSPAALLWSLPLTAGYGLAVPFVVFTASPAVGRFFRRHGIAGIPEDFAPPAEIRAVQAGS
ncbi:glucans biosynthesis glucosyltransferase MdoH [Hyphomicrobium sp. ghe19]|uniref:glucans biosynthesis glucosyltransferase MdoH n=1 Tax=Hyphomicrobium sp. ghe19 TaxID=2682968 RepID=UPI0013674E8B|nr:Glucans biosynthesis glucosyltransferase H [Hyphomicrobium sp. ghe19]